MPPITRRSTRAASRAGAAQEPEGDLAQDLPSRERNATSDGSRGKKRPASEIDDGTTATLPDRSQSKKISSARESHVRQSVKDQKVASKKKGRISSTSQAKAPEALPVSLKSAKDDDPVPHTSSVDKTSSLVFTDFTIAPPASSSKSSSTTASAVHCQRSHPLSLPRVPSLIFTHGAGGDLTAPAMVDFSTGFATPETSIVMFQGSMNLKSRTAGFSTVLQYEVSLVEQQEQKSEPRKRPSDEERAVVAFGGRSMGARAAVMAATDLLSQSKPSALPLPKVTSLVLSSYPLISPTGDVRDQILLSLPESVDVLFISGDGDNMCPVPRLQQVRKKMKAPSWLVLVKGADHGMKIKGGKDLKKGTELIGKACGRIAREWVLGKGREEKGPGSREMSVRWDGIEGGKVLVEGW